jgi:hypothetical protein
MLRSNSITISILQLTVKSINIIVLAVDVKSIKKKPTINLVGFFYVLRHQTNEH